MTDYCYNPKSKKYQSTKQRMPKIEERLKKRGSIDVDTVEKCKFAFTTLG